MKATYSFQVHNGQIQAVNQDIFEKHLREFEIKPGLITLEPYKKRRGNQSNRYYWGVVIEYVIQGFNDLGELVSKEQAHEFLKDRFLFNNKREVPVVDGIVLEIPATTTTLSVDEFGQYIEHCVQFAAEYLNVVIPAPDKK